MKKLVFAALAAALLTGCGSRNEAEGESGNSQISVETGEETAQQNGKDSILGDAEDNYIDYNQVCANIIIDGEVYSMPFTYDDIKKNYDCEKAKKTSTEGYYAASFINSEGKRFTVEIKDTESGGEDLNNKPITSVMVSGIVFDTEGNYYYDDLEEEAADISFNGVRIGMTLEEVQAAWGGADMYQDQDKKGIAYTYMSADKKMTVQVMVDSDNKVYSIVLVNHRI